MDHSALQHPADVTAARAPYAVAVALRTVSSPHSFVALSLALFTISDNVVTPLVGPFLGLLICAYVERGFRADAWAFIPRRRQDATRPEPWTWWALARGAECAALVAASVVFASFAGTSPIVTDASATAVGMLSALALCTIAVFTWDRLAPRRWRTENAPIGLAACFALATATTSALTVIALLPRAPWTQTGFLVGAAACVLFAASTLAMRLIPGRIRCLPEAMIE